MALPSGSVGAQRQNCVNWLPSEGYAQRARRAATQSPHQQRRLERQRPAAKVKVAPETNSGSVPELHERCGLHGFRVHDRRQTVGMGLREAGVPGVDARGHPLAQPCRDDGALLGGAGAGDPCCAGADHRRAACQQRLARIADCPAPRSGPRRSPRGKKNGLGGKSPKPLM